MKWTCVRLYASDHPWWRKQMKESKLSPYRILVPALCRKRSEICGVPPIAVVPFSSLCKMAYLCGMKRLNVQNFTEAAYPDEVSCCAVQHETAIRESLEKSNFPDVDKLRRRVYIEAKIAPRHPECAIPRHAEDSPRIDQRTLYEGVAVPRPH